MKIVVDDKIPYIKGALEPFAEVLYCAGSKTTPELVKDADAIVTRTRTICNESLLKGSSVKMIATATIGFDHIDTAYCEANGIEWTNAKGCNSWSVHQYMAAALCYVAREKNLTFSNLTIGIIGVGQVGSKVAKLCRSLGMIVLLNDPPRQRSEGDGEFVSLDEICRRSDIITVHTPLIREGIDKTYHLIDESFISKCAKNIILFNAARGEITDTTAVKKSIDQNKISGVVIDCWEHEPEIDLDLLGKSILSTPHIAGYSRDGKANGTSMSVQAISRKFGLGIDNWICENVEMPENSTIEIDGKGKTEQNIIAEAVWATYPIWEDSLRLRASVSTFEKQRGDYPVRREFGSYTIKASNMSESTLNKLSELGFTCA